MSEVFRCSCGFESPAVTLAGPGEATPCPACGKTFSLNPPAEIDVVTQTNVFDPILHAAVEEDDSDHLPPLADEPPRRRRKSKPLPPPDIPGYVILGELGRGGMGVVYKARQVSLNRVVALKMILAGAHASAVDRERFRKEAEAVARLQHPGIVQIFDIGEHAGQPYLALEFVDGGSLAQLLANGNLPPVKTAVELVIAVAVSMQYAHDLGVIHRDLKPANVLLLGTRREDRGSSDSGSGSGPRSGLTPQLPKVTDFGLAKRLDESIGSGVTKSGAVMGTPSYISPEQASGKPERIVPASDVYSLGAILYELLTGRPPFKGGTPLETILQVLNDDPVPPSRLRNRLHRDIETICLKCLHKDPNKRYGSAQAMADDLSRFLDGKPIQARPLSGVARGLKWARRHPASTAFGIATLFALVAVVVVLAVAYSHVREAVRDKETEALAAKKEKENADKLRVEAEGNKQEAEKFAGELGLALDDAELKAELLRIQVDANERNLYALLLGQVSTLCERDPKLALKLLDERCPEPLRDFTWRYLRKLCQRDDRAHVGHADKVMAVAASPDGTLVATADGSGVVRLWNPSTKTTYALLHGHVGAVNAVAFAPTGESLVTTGDDGKVLLWDLPAGFLTLVRDTAKLFPETQADWMPKLPAALQITRVIRPTRDLGGFGHRGRCVAFSPDGHTVAAGGSDTASAKGSGKPDGAAKIWDLPGRAINLPVGAATGGGFAFARFRAGGFAAEEPVRLLRTITDHLRPVVSMAFSPDGGTLATGSEDQSAQLNRIAGGRPSILPLHPDAVTALAFSPDGNTLATAYNAADPVVVLWEQTPLGVRERGRLNGHTKAIYAVAYAPDGRAVAASGFNGVIRLWDPDSGQEKSRLFGHDDHVRCLAFLPNSRQLVSGSNDRTARMWQTAVRRSEVRALAAEGMGTVTAAALSRNGRLVTGEGTGGVRVWLLDPFLLRGAKQNKPGQLALVGNATGFVGEVKAVAVSGNSQFVVAAGVGGLVVWDTTTGIQPQDSGPRTFTGTQLVKGKTVSAVAIAPDGKTLAAADGDGVRLWNLHTGEPIGDKPVVDGAGVRSVAFAPGVGGDREAGLLAVGQGRAVRLIDLRTGKSATIADAHEGLVECMAFGPLGETLATGGSGGAIRIWAVASDDKGIRHRRLSDPAGHNEPVTDIAFTGDGKTLLSVGMDRLLTAWDPTTGQERATFPGHTDRLVKVAVAARDMEVVTVGRDGSVRRWKADPRPTPPAIPPARGR